MRLKVYQLGSHSNMEKKKKNQQNLASDFRDYCQGWVNGLKSESIQRKKLSILGTWQGKNDKSGSQRTKSGKQWQRICTIDREPPAHIRH